jgi:hypothetical protein
MTIATMYELIERGNTIVDPFSTLISSAVHIGTGNVVHPSVIMQCEHEGRLTIGNGNVFWPGSLVVADGGTVVIGDGNHFGDGGCALKANRKESRIIVGDLGRYLNGAIVLGQTTLGSGSQVIGSITVQDCELGAGQSCSDPVPSKRGGVLKGFGLARGLFVGQGQVVNGVGEFAQHQIEDQDRYHK